MSSSNARRIPADRIEQVAVMFPQLNRRDIEYDLSRNGANVAATTERVLREGRLPVVGFGFVLFVLVWAWVLCLHLCGRECED